MWGKSIMDKTRLVGTREEINNYLLELKERKRKKLASLPIEEKIKMVIRMYIQDEAIRKATGR